MDINKKLGHVINKNEKIYTAAVLDNYTFYPKRFLLKKKYNYPNCFWTFDRRSFLLAKKYFPNQKVNLINNYYFEDLKKRYTNSGLKSNKALYISEPIGNLDYENESLNFFLQNMEFKKKFRINEVLIKLHPRDKKNKYNKIIYKYKITKSNQTDNVKLFNKCKLVLGLSSYLLLMSAKLNINTYHCKLPSQKGIKLLKDSKIKSFYKLANK